MKATIGVIALGLLVGGCAGGSGAMPAAEIDSMSEDRIGVVYYDSVSGMGDATQIALQHCDPLGAEPIGSSDVGAAPDRTLVTFQCRPVPVTD